MGGFPWGDYNYNVRSQKEQKIKNKDNNKISFKAYH